MFSLTASFFVVEIVVGHITNSMALIADSFHMLSDIAALVIAFISVKMAPKSWDKNTYGWARAEVLGKLTRSKKRTWLFVLFFPLWQQSPKSICLFGGSSWCSQWAREPAAVKFSSNRSVNKDDLDLGPRTKPAILNFDIKAIICRHIWKTVNIYLFANSKLHHEVMQFFEIESYSILKCN